MTGLIKYLWPKNHENQVGNLNAWGPPILLQVHQLSLSSLDSKLQDSTFVSQLHTAKQKKKKGNKTALKHVQISFISIFFLSVMLQKNIGKSLLSADWFLTSTTRRYPSSSSLPFETNIGSPINLLAPTVHVWIDLSDKSSFTTVSKGKCGNVWREPEELAA